MNTPVSTTTALLQALSAGPAFGLELVERLKVWTLGELQIHEGSLYPALRELERDGLIAKTTGPQRQPGRPRRYVRITEAGLEVAARDRRIFAAMLAAYVFHQGGP